MAFSLDREGDAGKIFQISRHSYRNRLVIANMMQSDGYYEKIDRIKILG